MACMRVHVLENNEGLLERDFGLRRLRFDTPRSSEFKEPDTGCRVPERPRGDKDRMRKVPPGATVSAPLPSWAA